MNSQVPYKVEFEVPNGLLDVEGNDGTDLPFSYLGPVRYQQVYDASQFTRVPAGGAFITRMFVRADCNSVGNQISSNIQLRLSTTSRGPDQLSAVFEDNPGPDETVVWNASRYIPPAGLPDNCPNTFFNSNEFYIDNPFFYDPARGNLLLDLRKESTERNPALWWPPKLDAENVMGDSVSRAVAFSLTTNKAEIVDTAGLVTYFEIFLTPTLKATYGTNTVILTWFWTPKNTFRLQWTDQVDTGASWFDYAGEIVRSGFSYRATVPTAGFGASRFFRLFWDTPQPLGGPLITTPVQVKDAPNP